MSGVPLSWGAVALALALALGSVGVGCGDSSSPDPSSDGEGATDASVAPDDDAAANDAADADDVHVTLDADSASEDDGADVADVADVADADVTDAQTSGCPVPPFAPAGAEVTGSGLYRAVTGLDRPGLLPRGITVRLPPDYDADPDRRYPVLYMHDGQNLFFPERSAFGEWGVDEALDLLLAAGAIQPVLVVGLDNTPERIADYTPSVDPSYGGGNAAAYVTWLVETVKPAIDALFRTRCEAEATGLMGSSFGGLVSLYAALARPGVFGRVGAVSPSLWWDGARLLGEIATYEGPLPTRLWIDMGTAEGESTGDVTAHIARTRAARDWALARGMVLGEALGYLEDVGAGHNEGAWRARLPAILRFLYGTEPLGPATAATLGFFSSSLSLGDRPRTSAIVSTRHGAHARITRANAEVDFVVTGDAVTVDADGTVTAAAVGSARVTASVVAQSASAELTVSSEALAWVVFSVSVPADTPSSDVVHLSGDLPELGAWSPDGVALTHDPTTGRWRVGLALPRGGPFAYKYTRGTWETVEASSTGFDVPNRTSPGATPGVRSDTVIRWKDR